MQIKIGLSTGQVASLKDAMNERGRRGTGIRGRSGRLEPHPSGRVSVLTPVQCVIGESSLESQRVEPVVCYHLSDDAAVV